MAIKGGVPRSGPRAKRSWTPLTKGNERLFDFELSEDLERREVERTEEALERFEVEPREEVLFRGMSKSETKSHNDPRPMICV